MPYDPPKKKGQKMKIKDIGKANKLVAKIEQADDILEAIGEEKYSLKRVDIEAVCGIGSPRRLYINIDEADFIRLIIYAVTEIRERAEKELEKL